MDYKHPEYKKKLYNLLEQKIEAAEKDDLPGYKQLNTEYSNILLANEGEAAMGGEFDLARNKIANYFTLKQAGKMDKAQAHLAEVKEFVKKAKK